MALSFPVACLFEKKEFGGHCVGLCGVWIGGALLVDYIYLDRSMSYEE